MRASISLGLVTGLCVLSLLTGCSGDETATAADGADTATDTTDGVDGSDATDTTATDGTDGTDGQTQTDQTDQSDGVDETDTTGTDETDGTDGVDGPCVEDGNCDVEGGETLENCPVDCTCGNGTCDESESFESCPDDCKCGNGTCDESESFESCPGDCKCGNGICEESETVQTCAEDCKCGNSVCDEGETFDNCAADCPCGNGVCDTDQGEDENSCPVDCSCDAINQCAQEPTMPVCCGGTDFYPNFCYAQCALPDAFDVCGPYTPQTCAATNLCSNPDCNPAWADGQPVCWQSGAQSQTYDNPYDACCDGHNWLTDTDVSPGECGGGGNAACAPANACPPTVQLVCGTLDSEPYTFQSLCEFQLCADDGGNGPSLECEAPCGAFYECPACADDDACELVCGADGTTYRNDCYAACAGVTVDSPGACCDCPEPGGNEQVCGQDGTTYGSECLLGCADGVLPAYIGPCVEGCTPQPDDLPACGFLDGQFITFANAECAQAAGATCVYDGQCAPGTFNPCPLTDPVYEPVCAAVAGGQAQSYANACFAGCAGATVQFAGLCEDCTTSPTLCPPEAIEDAQPTCVVEECVLYPNDCYPKKCTGNPDATLQKFACPENCGQPQE